MATYRVQGPDGAIHRIEGPENATPEQIESFARRQFTPVEKAKPFNPTDGMSELSKLLAGAGKGFVDLGRGAGQMLDLVSQSEVDDARKYEAPLMNTGAGIVGNVIGSVAATVPALAIPGANSVGGAAVVGGALNALQPTAQGESRLQNAAIGAVTGGGAQAVLGKVAGVAGNRLASAEAEAAKQAAANSVKDEAIAAAQKLGFKTIPSVSNGSLLGRVVEGASGTAKAKQLASVQNQPLTDSLVRKALSIADDAPITKETMAVVRTEAVQAGYDPIRQVPRMGVDQTFKNDIRALTSRADNASKDFGQLVESDVKPLVKKLESIKSFTGDSAVDAVAVLREKASDLYAKGDKTLGGAYRKASEAIESQIERGLVKNGKQGADLVKDFRAARTKIAQTFDVEKALREGQGHVDANALGRLYAKNPKRMSGELAEIGRAASAMPEVMRVPQAGWSNPVSALDSGGSVFASILSGHPLPLMYGPARAGLRHGLLSDMGQKLTKPKYGPGLANRSTTELLEQMNERGLGGLLGSSIYSAQ